MSQFQKELKELSLTLIGNIKNHQQYQKIHVKLDINGIKIDVLKIVVKVKKVKVKKLSLDKNQILSKITVFVKNVMMLIV